MDRRKFLIGMGSLTVGGAAVVGSGAFTSVQANRPIEVSVAEDASAYLNINPASSPNGAYAEITGDTIEINLNDDADVDGSGLNAEADTTIEDIVAVTNEGTQGVGLSVDVAFDSSIGNNSEFSVLANGSPGDGGGLSSDLEEEWVDLDVGETVYLGAEITTTSVADLEGDVTIKADAAEYSS